MTMALSSQNLGSIGCALRTAVVLSYIIWVAVGAYILHEGRVMPGKLQYVATKALPTGHRLHSDDFTFSPRVPPGERSLLPPGADPIGQYLVREMERGKPFGASEISSAPIIQVGSGNVKRLFPLKGQPYLADTLNTNSHVSVCSGSCAIDNARVLSIVCGTATPADCYVILEITKTDESNLRDNVEYKLILRRN